MGDIIVYPKGFAKLLDRLNVHKASGLDGLNAKVPKECSHEISLMLALVFKESLGQGDVPDDWRQANVSKVFKMVKIRSCKLQTSVAHMHLLQTP